MPYFDYCLSLSIYFTKRSIQKLSNSYYYCVQRLLNIRPNIHGNNDFNTLNIELNKFNIDCFQHRIIKRLAHFVHKIVNLKTSPVDLKEVLISNRSKNVDYNLRNSNDYLAPSKGKFNDYVEK
ncbi:hypothetical protein BpHYR1_050043, partial [Brachionus plicatilis]